MMRNPRAKIVVFDLGGVMVRIARTWGEAAKHAGIPLGRPDRGVARLVELPGFEPYQAQQNSFDEYLGEVRAFLELRDFCEARAIHDAILLDPYPGTRELVDELHAMGLRTGCLSNTNAPHWERMRRPELYPAVASLEVPGLSHELGLGKPAPEIYTAFEALAGLGPEDIVFFEDTAANAEAARARGWEAHVVDPGGDTAAQMRTRLLT